MNEMPNLRGMTRDELNAYAGECGIADAAAYPNKDALVEAVEAAQAEPMAPVGPEPDDPAGTDDGYKEDGAGEGETIVGVRYLVLKAITLADGRTVMPGEEFVPDADFPARRPKQLVDQKFLRPID